MHQSPGVKLIIFILSAEQLAEKSSDAAHALSLLYRLAALHHICVLPFRAEKCGIVHHVVFHRIFSHSKSPFCRLLFALAFVLYLITI